MAWNPFKQRDEARARFERLRHGRPMDTRESSAARGYGAKWQKYRAHFLAIRPLCERCAQAGRTEPAVVVDHVVPVQGPLDPRFWELTNHQSLCHACHNSKTAEDKKAGTTRKAVGIGVTEGTEIGRGETTERIEGAADSEAPVIVKNPRRRPRKGGTT